MTNIVTTTSLVDGMTRFCKWIEWMSKSLTRSHYSAIPFIRLLMTLIEPDPESVRYTCVNPSWLQNIYFIPIFDIIFPIPRPNSSPIDINPFFPGQKQANSIHFTPSGPSFKPRPQYAGDIWKRRFISTVRPTVHTNLLRKRSFSKTLFKPEEFENAGFAF